MTAARPMKLATSMCSGAIRYSPPPSRSTPWMRSTFDPIPSICAPSETRNRQRSWTCGSHAALPITVSPSASTAAMTAFSVPITLASSRKTCLPRRRSACELERAVDRDLRAELLERVDVHVESPAADHVAARRRQRRAAEAREQRAGDEERGADAVAEPGSTLGLATCSASTRTSFGPSTPPLRRGCRAARPSSRRRGSAGRSSSVTGSVASKVAARIGSAPFLFPAARTRPFSGRPPSITKDSASVLATTMSEPSR